MERRTRISLFAKSTRVENMGPGNLVFRVTQGEGDNEKQVFISLVRPHGHMYCFSSDIYRNDSQENPIHVYVRLEEYGEEQAMEWTPLDRSLFGNAAIRIAGIGPTESPPVAIEPFKGSKIGRLRAVVKMKHGIKKIMTKIGFGG